MAGPLRLAMSAAQEVLPVRRRYGARYDARKAFPAAAFTLAP
jgi:hypothetical protein